VNPTRQKRLARLQRTAHPEVVEAYRAGQLSVRNIKEFVRLSPHQQLAELHRRQAAARPGTITHAAFFDKRLVGSSRAIYSDARARKLPRVSLRHGQGSGLTWSLTLSLNAIGAALEFCGAVLF
jgi:hypothetical protein